MKVRRTYYLDKSMVQDISETAAKIGIRDADVIRLAVKEFVRKEKRKV